MKLCCWFGSEIDKTNVSWNGSGLDEKNAAEKKAEISLKLIFYFATNCPATNCPGTLQHNLPVSIWTKRCFSCHKIVFLWSRFCSTGTSWVPHLEMSRAWHRLQSSMAFCYAGLSLYQRSNLSSFGDSSRNSFSKNLEQASQSTCFIKHSLVKVK